MDPFSTNFVIVPAQACSGDAQTGSIDTEYIEEKVLDEDVRHTKIGERLIVKCIGQVLSDFGFKGSGGESVLSGGTGTVIDRLDSNHMVILSCAHNVAKSCLEDEDSDDENDDFDDDEYVTNPKFPRNPAQQVYFLPDNTDIDSRMTAIACVCHPDWDPSQKPNDYDLALILCKDEKNYYKAYENKDFASLSLSNVGKETFKGEIYGYPIQYVTPDNYLWGQAGQIRKMRKFDKYKYKIETFPGHSGAAIFEEINEEKKKEEAPQYSIHGVHIFGNVKTQVNHGVKFDVNKYNWIDGIKSTMRVDLNNLKDYLKLNKLLNPKICSQVKEMKLKKQIKFYKNLKQLLIDSNIDPNVDEKDSEDEDMKIGAPRKGGTNQLGIFPKFRSSKYIFEVGKNLNKLSISDEDIKEAKKIYEKQFDDLGLGGWASSIVDKKDLMYFLSVQQQEKVPFLAFLAESYNNQNNIPIEKWAKNHKLMRHMKKTAPKKEKKLQNAIQLYIENIINPFQISLPSELQINDDINDVIDYFRTIQIFVCGQRKKKLAPFQIDLLLTLRRKAAGDDAKGDDAKDDDAKVDNAKDDNDLNNVKNIDVTSRINVAKCISVPPVSISKDATRAEIRKAIRETHGKLKKAYDAKNNGQMQRFEVFIDRRDENEHKLIMFEAPADCNTFADKYLPEFQLALVKKCLIPGKDKNITASDGLGGELMTFSFQVGLENEQKTVKCLLIWNGGTRRFRGRDITHILYGLFANAKQQIGNDKKIKNLGKTIDKEMLSDYFDVDV